jgi:hypothetical protein
MFLRGALTGDKSQNNIQDPSPQPSSRKQSPMPSPGGLAKALTALEGKIYNRLLPADYIVYFMRLSTEGNITDACNLYKTINNWVKKSILTPKDYEVRAEAFKFFVNTTIVRLSSLD